MKEQPMPERAAAARPSYRVRSRRLRLLGLLAGLGMMFLAAPALTVVVLVAKADWALVAALMTFGAGLFTVGGVIAPRTSRPIPHVQVMVTNGEVLLTPDVVLRDTPIEGS